MNESTTYSHIEAPFNASFIRVYGMLVLTLLAGPLACGVCKAAPEKDMIPSNLSALEVKKRISISRCKDRIDQYHRVYRFRYMKGSVKQDEVVADYKEAAAIESYAGDYIEKSGPTVNFDDRRYKYIFTIYSLKLRNFIYLKCGMNGR